MVREINEMLENISFHLCDTNVEIVKYWKSYFSDYENFKFYHEDLIKVYDRVCCESTKNIENKKYGIVSPANSFGDMQGGIDLIFYTKFGWKLEELVMQNIIKYKFGELVVGDCIIVEIPKDDFSSQKQIKKYLLVAPTMRVPMGIKGTVNVYLAFRAALISLLTANNNITDVFVSGMGTGIGKVEPNICAKQMFYAYHNLLNPKAHNDLIQMTREHVDLLN